VNLKVFEPTALLELLGEAYDVTDYDQAVEAGRTLLEIVDKCAIALGEIVEVWRRKTKADERGEMNDLYLQFAREWNVSKTTVIRAHVRASKYRGIKQPADMCDTIDYEIRSGAQDEADAEAGFETAIEEGYTVSDVRLVKQLRAQGYQGWQRPRLFMNDDEAICTTTDEGDVLEVWVRRRNGHPEREAEAVATLRFKANI
jgi:hypothetical protein